MEKTLFYTLRFIMFCTILYAARIPDLQRYMLYDIKDTVDNLTAQALEGRVNAVRRNRVCVKDFFCLAEKSLSAVNISQLGKLCTLLDRYNNETGHTTCELQALGEISIKELLGQLHSCTVKALRNHTQERHRVRPSLWTSL